MPFYPTRPTLRDTYTAAVQATNNGVVRSLSATSLNAAAIGMAIAEKMPAPNLQSVKAMAATSALMFLNSAWNSAFVSADYDSYARSQDSSDELTKWLNSHANAGRAATCAATATMGTTAVILLDGHLHSQNTKHSDLLCAPGSVAPTFAILACTLALIKSRKPRAPRP